MVGNYILNLYSSQVYNLSGADPKIGCLIQGAGSFSGAILGVFLSRFFGRKPIFIVGYFLITVTNILVVFGAHFSIPPLVVSSTAALSFVFNSCISVSLIYV